MTLPPTQPAADAVDILVVDDNAENLVAFTAILSDVGARVVTASSGRDALRVLLRQDFAVVLLDVHMPLVDGFETARLVRSRPRSQHTPIIFITAHADEARLARGYALGAVDYILTPVVPEILRAKVGVFIDLYRKTLEVRRQSECLAKRAEQLHRLSEAALAVTAARTVEEIVETVAEWARDIVGAAAVWACATPGHNRVHERQMGALDGGRVPASRLRLSFRGQDAREIGSLEVATLDQELSPEDRAVLRQLADMASIALQNLIFAEERETNRLKDDFIATVSHELRTPLAAILTWARLLREDGLQDGARTRGVEVIERNARAQAQLIDDLLDMSRIMTGKMRIEFQTLALPDVVTAAVEAVRPAAEARGVALEWTPPSERVAVAGDADRLQQVLWNLLANAIKFTDAGGRIAVDLGVAGEAEVRVHDTGVGIAPEFLPHVFDRFRQADSSSTRAHRGLGLGLAIVRQLVELHGGSVHAESPGPGHGSVFVVRLPLARVVPEAVEESHADGSAAVREMPLDVGVLPSLAGLRVLVVEDDPDACEAVCLLLGAAGATVRSADSAPVALTTLADWWPDVLVSDIGLPGEDGYVLLRRVREFQAEAARPDVPAVALTAYAQASDRGRALAAGFQAYLAKPVEAHRLVELLANLRAPRVETDRVAGAR